MEDYALHGRGGDDGGGGSVITSILKRERGLYARSAARPCGSLIRHSYRGPVLAFSKFSLSFLKSLIAVLFVSYLTLELA